MNDVEVAVIGGGPAGAAAACGLAAAGREVVLLEHSAGPHHKVCGEFLRPEAVERLGRLGIDPTRLGAVAVDRLAVTAGRRCQVVPLPFVALSLSRYRLDQALIERAVRAGAVLRRGVAVQSVHPATRGWRLRCSDGTEIGCRSVVLATGKRPVRGLADRRDGSMVGLKMHVRLPDTAARALAGRVELFLFDHGYAGLEAIEDGIANLCMLMPQSLAARTARGGTELQSSLAGISPALAGRLAGAAPLWEKPLAVVCPARGHLHRTFAAAADGVYPIGDRFAHIPPFAGDGLAIALGSAAIAIDHIRRGLPSSAYLGEARRRIAPAVRFAAILSRLCEFASGRTAIGLAAAVAPALLQAAASAPWISTFLRQDHAVHQGAGFVSGPHRGDALQKRQEVCSARRRKSP